MSIDLLGYVLPRDAGDPMWFLDTRMTVKAEGDQTGGTFTVLQWSAPVGFSPPRHVHHRKHEAFYLLETYPRPVYYSYGSLSHARWETMAARLQGLFVDTAARRPPARPADLDREELVR